MLREVAAAGILGVGACIPSNIRKNDFWDDITFKTLKKKGSPFEGIEERRYFDEEWLPSDAEAEAGKKAMEDAGVSPAEIDLIMVQSMQQDEILPGNASLVQHKLGLKNAGAWNIDSCCSSFVTMTVIAANLIAMKQFKKILIITSAFNSRFADYTDYLCCYLGDGAGAVVMGEVSEDKGYIDSHCISNGALHKAFTLQNEVRKEGEKHIAKHILTFDFEQVHEAGRDSTKYVSEVLTKTLEKCNLTGEKIDLFLSHQPVHWAHGVWRDLVNIPSENSYQTFAKYGNIASATVPINLFEAKQKGMLKEGDHLLIMSPGAGENHIAAIFKWGK